MFDPVKYCIRCGFDLDIDDENRLVLQAYGGYGDFIDTAFDDEARMLQLCHDCAHKFLLWIGPNSTSFVDSFNSGSHFRHEGNAWHHGWDNLTVRGLISAIIFEVRLHKSLWGVKIAIDKVFKGRQEWIDQAQTWLNEVKSNPEKYSADALQKAEADLKQVIEWRW